MEGLRGNFATYPLPFSVPKSHRKQDGNPPGICFCHIKEPLFARTKVRIIFRISVKYAYCSLFQGSVSMFCRIFHAVK